METNCLPPWEVGVRQGGDMNIEVMKKNLLDFKCVMDKNGLPFVLFFGTLLGLIREKSFITYDTDVDVFCFWEDYLKWFKVRNELRNFGFVVVDEKPLHDEHLIRDGEKIEVWWCGKVKDQLVYDNNIRFDENLILPMKKAQFLGRQFDIPAQPEKVLQLLYGNWATPCRTTKGCTYRAL